MSKRIIEELQTCMDVIRNLTVSLGQENEQAQTVIRDLLEGVQAAQSILESMVEDREAGSEPTNLVEVIERAARFALATRDFDIDWQLDTPLAIVSVDPGRLWDVILNLVLNAFDADAHSLTIRLESRERAHRVEIEDDGTGVPEHLRQRIFDPGVSTKGQARGQGLSISRATIESFGGTLELAAARSGTGARFVIDLPAVTLE